MLLFLTVSTTVFAQKTFILSSKDLGGEGTKTFRVLMDLDAMEVINPLNCIRNMHQKDPKVLPLRCMILMLQPEVDSRIG